MGKLITQGNVANHAEVLPQCYPIANRKRTLMTDSNELRQQRRENGAKRQDEALDRFRQDILGGERFETAVLRDPNFVAEGAAEYAAERFVGEQMFLETSQEHLAYKAGVEALRTAEMARVQAIRAAVIAEVNGQRITTSARDIKFLMLIVVALLAYIARQVA